MNYAYQRIPQDEYDKIIGQFRILCSNILEPLRKYGQSQYADIALAAIVQATEEACMKVRGKQQPYTVPPHVTGRYFADD